MGEDEYQEVDPPLLCTRHCVCRCAKQCMYLWFVYFICTEVLHFTHDLQFWRFSAARNIDGRICWCNVHMLSYDFSIFTALISTSNHAEHYLRLQIFYAWKSSTAGSGIRKCPHNFIQCSIDALHRSTRLAVGGALALCKVSGNA